ncbi:MAG: hypothetical protein PHT60_14170 [Acidiphilium sp.]|nr:hypothetical protein [Acidiphilium sp.]MDD4936909.1 hypothetical protein [Acidiphilium sp.]
MGPVIIPLEPLLAAMGAYVLGELGIETTKKMLKHAANADEAGRATAVVPAASRRRPMPDFIPENGSTLHLVGVCFNRIGMYHSIRQKL